MAPQFLTDMLGEAPAGLLVRLVLAIVVLLVTYVLRRVSTRLVRPIIALLDRTVDRLRRADFPLDKQLIKVLDPPMGLLVMTIGIWLSLAIVLFGLPGLSPKVTAFVNVTASSFIAAAFFWAVFRFVDVGAYYLQMVEDDYNGLDTTLINFGSQITKLIVVLLAVVVITEQWGYNLSALLAGLGLGGVAVALAAQDAVANLIGYFSIMSDRPFETGDYIVADTFSGSVEKIGFRSTRFRKPDQSLVIVPNKTVSMASITNWSRLEKRRLDMTLGVQPDSSPAKVLMVVRDIRDLLLAQEQVNPDSVVVQFTGFGESSLDIMILSVFDIPDWKAFQAYKEAINVEIMHILSRHGVRLALPKTVLLERQAQTDGSQGEPEAQMDSLPTAQAAAAAAAAEEGS